MISSTTRTTIRSITRTMTRTRLRPAMLALIAPLLLLTACTQPPWQQNSLSVRAKAPVAVTSPTAKTSTPAATKTPTPAASTPAAQNDMAKGSIQRTLSAGGVELSVHYWSTLPVDKWTATATKPMTMSVTAKFSDGSLQNVYLHSLTLTTDVNGAHGALQAPAVITDQASFAPGYLMKAPSSYGNVINIPALDPTATSITLNFNYQLLAQSAPKSKTFLKQAAGDTVVIALAH